jgi:hypothetical protein
MMNEPSYPEVASNANNNAVYGAPYYSGMPTGNMMQMPYGNGGYMPTNMPMGQQQQPQQQAPPVHAMQSMYDNMQLSQQQQQQQQMQQQQMTGLGAQQPQGAPQPHGSQTVSVLDFKPDVLAHHQQQQMQQQMQQQFQAAHNARAAQASSTMGLMHPDGRYIPATDAMAAHGGQYPAGYPRDPAEYTSNTHNTGAYAGRPNSMYNTDAMMPADHHDAYYPNTGGHAAANDAAYAARNAAAAGRERRARAFEHDRFPPRPSTEGAAAGGGGMSPSAVQELIDERLHLSSSAEAKRTEQKRQVGSAVKKVMENYDVTPKSGSCASDSFDAGGTSSRRGGSARPDYDGGMGETSSRRGGGGARADYEYRPY